MKKSLVWDIIQCFSKKEIKTFRQFLASPYFNQRADLRHLFDYLIGVQIAGKAAPTREVLYGELFPNEVFDDQKLRLLVSYLLKLLETFLILEESKLNKFPNHKLLLTAYRKRNLNRHFQKSLNRTQKLFQHQQFRHSEFYYYNFLVESERYQFLSATGRTQEMNLQEVENNLDAAFLSMKLRQACFLRSHELVYNTHYQISLLEEILDLASQPAFIENPAISIYCHCFKALFQSEDERDFQAFKNKLYELTPHFPKAEIRDLYLLAINYCIRKLNEGKASFLQETLDLYQRGLENELLLENGQLSRFAFNNIAGIAIRLGRFDWIENFMKSYKSYLNPKYREITFSLNAAKLEYTRKNYSLALQYLQKADYKDLINNMVAKTLQLKIYYELGEFDLLDSLLNTMRIFIRRNKKMGYHHENWTNIVRYTKKLAELNQFDRASTEALKIAIEKEEILTEKEWLLRQLE